MFELVEQQPSHLACPDVLNLSLGESEPAGPRPLRRSAGRALSCPVSLLPPGLVPVAFDL